MTTLELLMDVAPRITAERRLRPNHRHIRPPRSSHRGVKTLRMHELLTDAMTHVPPLTVTHSPRLIYFFFLPGSHWRNV